MKKFLAAGLICAAAVPANADHGSIMAFSTEAACESWIAEERAFWRSADSREARRDLRSANRDNSATQYHCVQEIDGSWHVVSTTPGSEACDERWC